MQTLEWSSGKLAGRGRAAGFSLLELVMAMGVAAFTMLALLGFLVFIGRTAAETDAGANALFCAQQKLEELRARAMAGGSSGEGEDTPDPVEAPAMLRRWSVHYESFEPALLRVRVECSCGVAGREVRKALESLVCPGE